jgi:hypothetical protein
VDDLAMTVECKPLATVPGRYVLRVVLKAGASVRRDVSVHVAFDAKRVTQLRLLGEPRDNSMSTRDSIRVELGNLPGGAATTVSCELELDTATKMAADAEIAIITVSYESGGEAFADRKVLKMGTVTGR